MRFLRALVPDSLAARLSLVLAVALVAANLVALAMISFERERIGREARLMSDLGRLVTAAQTLEALPPARRADASRRFDRRGERLRLSRRPSVGATTRDRASERLAERIADEFGDSRDVRVALHRRPWRTARGERRAGGGVRLSIELRTDDAPGRGQWLNARLGVPAPDRAPRGVAAFATLLGLSLAAVLLVALLFARRLTRPLRALAEAALAAGSGDRSARVAERGAREIREAASAFNAMQARIARFEAERSRTLAAVGHDLRTPITSLRIRAEMIDDEQREAMIATLDDMRVMVDGLVTYARSGEEGEATEEVEMTAFVARLCEERGATFAPSEPVAVRARPVAIGRAIGNLIDNALRYAGSARVRLDASAKEIRVIVEDDGPGIPSERIEAMTEPFVRGEASRSTETGGAGLGLSIALNVARAHGGDLTLANRAEGGLRAVLSLPRG